MRHKAVIAAAGIVLIAAFFIPGRPEDAGVAEFDGAQFMHHVEQLTSAEMEGRYTGSDGNETAMAYVESLLADYGIEPLADEGYRQSFTTPVMISGGVPTLSIGDGAGNEIYRIEEPEGMVVDSWPAMSDIDYSGDMLVLAGTIYTIAPEYVKDKVVFTAVTRLLPETVEEMMANGAKGIIYYSTEPRGNAWDDPNEIGNLYPQISHKNGTPFFVARVPQEIFLEVSRIATEEPIPEHSKKRTNSDVWLEFSGWIHNVALKAEYAYPVVETANLYGILPADRATDENLVLGASLDGLGVWNDTLYPSAYNNASGVAFLLETARILAESDLNLDRNIIFAFWNGSNQGNMGTAFETERMPFDPSTSEMLVMEGLGSIGEGARIVYHNSHEANDPAGIFYTDLLQIAEDQGSELESAQLAAIHSASPYFDSAMPVISYVSDHYLETIVSPADTLENLSADAAQRDASLLLPLIEEEAGLSGFSLSAYRIPVGIWIGLIAWILLLWALRALPALRRGFAPLERASALLENLSASALVTAALFFGLMFVLQLPEYFMVGMRGDRLISNFSGTLTTRKTLLFLGDFFRLDSLSEHFVHEVWPLTAASLKLLLPALILAIVFGLAKGLVDGLSKHPVHRWISIGLYSIPDGFVAMVGLLGLVFLARNGWLPEDFDVQSARLFFIPILILSIVPAIYVTATVSQAVAEIKNEPFFKSLRARGLSRARIVMGHVFPIAFIRLMETMPSIVSVSLANLFILEYLYAYPGLGSYVIKNIWLPDKVIYFSLGIGMVYVALSLFFRTTVHLMTFRRKGVQHER